MYAKSVFLAALTACVASAGLLPFGFGDVPTSLAPSGTLPTDVPIAVPAGFNAPLLPRHGKKNKQDNANAPDDNAAQGNQTQQEAAQASGAAVAGNETVAEPAATACNGTAADPGNGQGNGGDGGRNGKRAFGQPVYPRHKGENIYPAFLLHLDISAGCTYHSNSHTPLFSRPIYTAPTYETFPSRDADFPFTGDKQNKNGASGACGSGNGTAAATGAAGAAGATGLANVAEVAKETAAARKY